MMILLLPVLFMSLAAFGQTTDRKVFQFKSTDTTQDAQEIATVIRLIGDIRDVDADTALKTLAVRGTDSQLAFADWLFKVLESSERDSAPLEYRLSRAGDELVHVFYAKNTATVQELQELATAVRSTTGIRRFFTYNAPNAMILRGTPEQITLAGWLIDQMDRTAFGATPSNPTAADYTATSAGDDRVKVLYLTSTPDSAAFQELTTLIRGVTDCRRAFTYFVPRALALRGTSEQLATAQWLANALGTPDLKRGSAPEFRLSNGVDRVRVFYLSSRESEATFQERVDRIRRATGMRRLFSYGDQRALAARGTANEISWAEQLIKEQAR